MHDYQGRPRVAADDVLQTPERWRILLAQSPRQAWKHAVAAVGHGWAQHAHHTGQPMQLTAAEYNAALEAAANGKLHEPAVSPYLARPKGDRK